MADKRIDGDLINHILFCTDFSEDSDLAFRYALGATLVRPGAKLTLLHVIQEPDAQYWKTYVYEVEGVDEKAKRDIDEKVKRYLDELPEGVNFETVFKVGREEEVILDYAKETGVDIIVMGRTGKSSLQKVFFGNVVERVVRKSSCPVVVVPTG